MSGKIKSKGEIKRGEKLFKVLRLQDKRQRKEMSKALDKCLVKLGGLVMA